MTLDIAPFLKAIAQVDEALVYCNSELALSDERLALHLRAAAIQAFELTYELTFKTLKRYLEATEVSPSEIDEMNFNNLVRRGLEAGLLSAELVAWKQFRKDRGTTSHTYNEDKAEAVFKSIPAFLQEAKYLAAQIQIRAERS